MLLQLFKRKVEATGFCSLSLYRSLEAFQWIGFRGRENKQIKKQRSTSYGMPTTLINWPYLKGKNRWNGNIKNKTIKLIRWNSKWQILLEKRSKWQSNFNQNTSTRPTIHATKKDKTIESYGITNLQYIYNEMVGYNKIAKLSHRMDVKEDAES